MRVPLQTKHDHRRYSRPSRPIGRFVFFPTWRPKSNYYILHHFRYQVGNLRQADRAAEQRIRRELYRLAHFRIPHQQTMVFANPPQ